MENTVLPAKFRFMGMAGDYDGPFPFDGVRGKIVPVMEYMEAQAAQIDGCRVRNVRGPIATIDVSANGGQWRNLGQAGQNSRSPDISGVDDMERSRQRFAGLGAEQAVGVRDHADAHVVIRSR